MLKYKRKRRDPEELAALLYLVLFIICGAILLAFIFAPSPGMLAEPYAMNVAQSTQFGE